MLPGRGTIFHKLLRPVLLTILFTATFWILTAFYLQAGIESAYEVRKLSHEAHIASLEMRRDQDEFFLQDATDPRFFKTGESKNIKEQAIFFQSAISTIGALSKVIPSDSLPTLEKLRSLLTVANENFLKLVALYKQNGRQPQWLASVSDSTLMKAYFHDVRAIEPIVLSLVTESDRRANTERKISSLVMAFVLFVSVSTAIIAIRILTKKISDPLVKLKDKVILFRQNDGTFERSVSNIVEIDLLDEAFFQMARNLNRTQKQLLQSQKMESMGTLAGGIAHDFNNLLAGIISYCGILKKKFTADSEAAKELNIIEQSAKRGAELTKQILGFARQGKHEKINFDLNKTILECRNLLCGTFEKTITIKAELEKDLRLVKGDPGQVFQILMNLGVNARDAMPSGGELIFESQNIEADEQFCRIHGHLKPGNYIRVSVSDTGTGIPKQIQDKIFDPFFTTKEVGKGTGLGLSMVFGIMQSHGGVVSVYSEPGHGAQFHLYFPAAMTGLLPLKNETAPATTLRTPSVQRLQGLVILVVDDEALMRDAARDLLESEGATLFVASDGEEALGFLEKNHSMISLVLMDVIMPKMDGIKALYEIKKINPNLPVILTSGYAESKPVSQAREIFSVGFIQKPYNTDALINLIHTNGDTGSKPNAA